MPQCYSLHLMLFGLQLMLSEMRNNDIIKSCPYSSPLLGTMATRETCQLGDGYHTDAASSSSSQSHTPFSPLFTLMLPPPLVNYSPPYSPSSRDQPIRRISGGRA